MKFSPLLLFVSLFLMLPGCATIGPTPVPTGTPTTPAQAKAINDLQTALTTDLNKAIVDATAATDIMAPVRLKCWQTLLTYVPSAPNVVVPGVGTAAGIFDKFELDAETVESIVPLAEFQIPPEVRVNLAVGCGPVAARVNDLLLRLGVKIGRVAGKAALIPAGL